MKTIRLRVLSLSLLACTSACSIVGKAGASGGLPVAEDVEKISIFLFPWSFTPMSLQTPDTLRTHGTVQMLIRDPVIAGELLAAIRYQDFATAKVRLPENFEPKLVMFLSAKGAETVLLSDGDLLCQSEEKKCLEVDDKFRARFDPIE